MENKQSMRESGKMEKIAVLIPCYNEAQTIEKVVTDWKRELPEATIYVYDNNSSDETAVIAEKAGAVVRHEYMQGELDLILHMIMQFDPSTICHIKSKGYEGIEGDCAKAPRVVSREEPFPLPHPSPS